MKKSLHIDRYFWIKFGITSIVGIGIMCLYNGIRSEWSVLRYYCDGCFIAAFAIICFSLLIILEGYGAFQMFSYYPSRKKLENGKKENYSEYCARHEQNRKSSRLFFVPFLFSGIIFLVISLILGACAGII